MALLFSAVTLTGDDDQVELLVPGIPKESNDLRGWTAYENFLASIDHEQEIRVHVAACLYGEGQPFLASPEEIAYFTLRAKEDDSFLCDHCSHAGHSAFQFTWSPEMSYGKESYVMNEWEHMHRQAERYKREYPAGTRITVLQMGDDPRPVENGTRGTVRVVDDMGTVHCDFDNGRRLGLIPGEDSFRKLTDAELAEEQDADISEKETCPVMGNCSSKSEFIEKAVRFYIGYLTAEDKSNYLPNMFLSNMRAIASESDNRVSRMLFKLTVELAMVMNLMAANYEIDPETLERLRGSCVREVKRLGGSFSMEDAVDWQNG